MSSLNLGIIGGGQLGSFLSVAAKKLNIRSIVYCDDINAPAKIFCDEFIFGEYSDKEKIQEFINRKILILKIILVVVLVITAVASIPFLITSGYVHFKHALEWNYFIGVVLFYLLSFLFWNKYRP